MLLRDKVFLVFLTIITLGLIWFFLKRKRKISHNLSTTKKHTFDIKLLIQTLGKDNIIKSEFTYSKIKIHLKKTSDDMLEKAKNIKGISGILMTSKSISIIVGSSAKFSSDEINKIIS